jgi:hypothetical protein
VIGTASGWEVTFVVLVGTGVLCNALCLREALKDLRVVPKDRPELRDLALSNIRAECVRLSVQSLFLAIFIVALFVPQGERAPQPWPSVFRGGFLLCTIALATNSVMNLRERRRFMQEPGGA